LLYPLHGFACSNLNSKRYTYHPKQLGYVTEFT
jgi:hypothetical protein